MENNITEKAAKILYKTKFWKSLSAREIVEFQLFTPRLCMPFDLFHKSAEEVLDRPIFSDEFSYMRDLRQEFIKKIGDNNELSRPAK